MALSMKLFGVNEIALRIPLILLSTICIWVIYFLSVTLFNRTTGVFAAFLFSINGLVIELTGGRTPTDHPDVFFLSFILFAVHQACVFFQKQKLGT